MFIICTVQVVGIKPKIQPILLGFLYLCHQGDFILVILKMGGGGALGSTALGGVYGLDLAPGPGIDNMWRNS